MEKHQNVGTKSAFTPSFDCVEFMPNANPGVHITKLDDSTGSYASKNCLDCQDSCVEEAGIILYALSGTPTFGTIRVRGKV